jgi:hypothetical protein
MARTGLRLIVLAALSLFVGAPAFASEVALAVGQTKVVSVAGTTKVVVADPCLVKARVIRGTGVALEGKAKGRTQVRIVAGGWEVALRLAPCLDHKTNLPF